MAMQRLCHEEGEGNEEEEEGEGAEEEAEEERLTNGQQLVVYLFGHGFSDTGPDRCYQPIYQNRSVLPTSFAILFLASGSVDETGPVAHFPFVPRHLLLLRSPTGYFTCWITYRKISYFSPDYQGLRWTSFFGTMRK